MSWDLFLKYAWDNRVVYFGGRLGGSKTALAHYVAYHLLQEKRYGFRWLVSNVPSVWADSVQDVTNNMQDTSGSLTADAVMILDEGGIFLKTAREADRLKYLRKLNLIVLVSSRTEPHRELQVATVRRTYNGYSAGLPYWRYGFNMSDGKNDEEFYFNWWFPKRIFGVYDTRAMPEDAEELLNAIDVWTNKGRAYAGHGTGTGTGTGTVNNGGNGTDVRIFDEFAAKVDEQRWLAAKMAKENERALSLLRRKSRKS